MQSIVRNGIPGKPLFISSCLCVDDQVHEYSDSESEELEYETEFEDIESSPTHERENDLDENNVYDRDLGVSSLPNEEIEVSYLLSSPETLI